MKRVITSSAIAWVLGVGVLGGITGCQSMFRTADTGESTSTKIVMARQNFAAETIVRVYNLRGVGLNDATSEEIEAFMETMRSMVVTKDWQKTKSSIQVFGVMMTIKTTPKDHLLIENYLNEVRRVMNDPTITLGAVLR